MIRPTIPEDTPALVELARTTGVFNPQDLEALREVLDDYHASNRDLGHECITYEPGGRIVAFAYFAPASMTQNTWYLWWIAVTKENHARGTGGKLLHHVEEEVRKKQGRVMFIETSSLPSYDLTRRFYLKHGYEQHAVLREYYADGHHMVIFRKRLSGKEVVD
jgi:ribosomal protein S18 acetylase RimI-like enzyme